MAEEYLQVNTDTGGWQACEISIYKISQWREVNGFNIPPEWQQVKIKGKGGKVITKWLPPNEAQWRLRTACGDLDVRQKAAETEIAWHGSGTKPGTWVWRINQFKVEAWDKDKYGQFHVGDSYVVLHVEKQNRNSEKLVYAVHFWIGKESTIDEQGTAAWKTTELDSYFNEEASQHREVQDGESDAFRSYFDKLEYLPGGVPPGWRVRPADLRSNTLTQVWRDGKKVIRHTEVPVTRESLNHRDAFILEMGDKAYIWFGNDAAPFVKQAARKTASESSKRKFVKEDVDEEFWRTLGGQGDIAAAADIGEEVQANFGEGKLYEMQVDDVTNKVSWKVKAQGDLHRKHLDTTGVMMVDTRTEMYVWIGKKANEAERKNAFHIANSYLKENRRDINTASITVLKEGSSQDLALPRWIDMFPLDS